MVLDESLIPQSHAPVLSKIDILAEAIGATISTLIFCFIAYTNRGIVCQRLNTFQTAALFSVLVTVILGIFDFFCWSNFLVAWDYLDADADFITSVDAVTVLMWCVSKCAFYFVFHQHIQQFFAIKYENVRNRMFIVRIAFITTATLVAFAGGVVVYADVHRANESELIRINPLLVMVNPCASMEWYNVAVHALIAISDLGYFVSLSFVYRQLYLSDNANENNYNGNAMAMAIERLHARNSNIFMLISTLLTALTETLIVFQVIGRWTSVWIGLTFDDFCVLYLVLGANSMLLAVKNATKSEISISNSDVELIGAASMSSTSELDSDMISDDQLH